MLLDKLMLTAAVASVSPNHHSNLHYIKLQLHQVFWNNLASACKEVFA